MRVCNIIIEYHLMEVFLKHCLRCNHIGSCHRRKWQASHELLCLDYKAVFNKFLFAFSLIPRHATLLLRWMYIAIMASPKKPSNIKKLLCWWHFVSELMFSSPVKLDLVIWFSLSIVYETLKVSADACDVKEVPWFLPYL